MLLSTNEAHVTVDGVISVRVAKVLKRATVLRKACELHLCSKFHLRRFLVSIEVFVLSFDLLTTTSDTRSLMRRAQVYPKKLLLRRKACRITILSRQHIPRTPFERAVGVG